MTPASEVLAGIAIFDRPADPADLSAAPAVLMGIPSTAIEYCMSPEKTDRRLARQNRAERIGEAIAVVLLAGVAAVCSTWLF